jgi:IS1 family transposase/transposase-like protein
MCSGLHRCIKKVGVRTDCPNCSGSGIKYGKDNLGKQRYHCRVCRKTFLLEYKHKAYEQHTNRWIAQLIKEGCGIRSIARLLGVAVNTVLRRILQIAKSIAKPIILFGKEYELDELCTYVKKKTNQRWVVYAIRKDTKEVVDFTIGSRTNKTLKRVVDTLILSAAGKVYTDKLHQYAYLIPREMHCTKQYGTNYIERKNLSLRTHLKRLNRRTICFSKSAAMLSACLKIYFWG